jgi:hypothetical protein
MNRIVSLQVTVFALGAVLVGPGMALCQTRQRTVTEEANNDVPREHMLVPFMEGTDVFLTSPSDTVFEARIAPHLIVKQTFGDVLDLPGQRARVEGGREAKHFGWVVSGTPAVILRTLRQVSDPVRTPSYMPRVNVQLLYATGVSRKLQENTGLLRKGSAPEIGVYEFHEMVGHHSNGQDGRLFIPQERIDNADSDAAADARRRGGPPDYQQTRRQLFDEHVRAGFNYRRTRVDSYTLVDDRLDGRARAEQHFLTDADVRPQWRHETDGLRRVREPAGRKVGSLVGP